MRDADPVTAAGTPDRSAHVLSGYSDQRDMTGGSAMISATYRVSGMTCEHCVRAVTAELNDLAGVTRVTVDLVPGGVSAVTVSSEAPLAGPDVEAALAEAGGYRLTGS
jgi:copper chaperone